MLLLGRVRLRHLLSSAIRCKPNQLVGILLLLTLITIQLRLKYVQKKSLAGVGKGTIVSLSDAV